MHSRKKRMRAGLQPVSSGLSVGSMDAAELLKRCATGDRVAFAQLYKASSPQFFAVLLRILTRPELAEEALQDSFVRIWMNAGSYRPGKGQPLTGMISIARYRAVDLYRRSRTEGLVADGDELLAAAESPERGPADLTELAGDRRMVHSTRLSASLPARGAARHAPG